MEKCVEEVFHYWNENYRDKFNSYSDMVKAFCNIYAWNDNMWHEMYAELMENV